LKGPKNLAPVKDRETGKDTYEYLPLNIFLRQELERFQTILTIVRNTMISMVQAIEGSISMTPEIVESINAMADARVPKKW